MSRAIFLSIAGRLMRTPTAPYYEAEVRAEVEAVCREHKLRFEQDRFGNVLVRLQTAPRARPFVLAAHLDHPAFEVAEAIDALRFRARFLGGVAEDYFRAGTFVRLMPGGIRARLGRRLPGEREFELLAVKAPRAKPAFAVWDLPEFSLRGRRIHGRACDDLIGVATILATIIELKRTRARVNVIGVLSRAEEVGFRGALALASTKLLPRNALIVSLETSKEIPPVQMGCGVILRVGDRTSIFDSAATRFLHEVALGLQQVGNKFQFQRALMSGGTCEATAYQEFGFQTAAVCVALGNYHNCGADSRILPEYVDLDDALSIICLLAEAARRMPEFKAITARLPERLAAMGREARQRLAADA